MPITTIPWGDGSGDNIYLSAPSQTGDQSVSVTSDPNTGAARSKVVTFSAVGVSPVSLTINQEAGTPQEVTLSVNPSSYSGTANNPEGAYDSETTTDYATTYLTKGANAETYCYFKFNTSSLPANATIVSVECKAKAYINNVTASYIATRQIRMYSGTTAKGTAQTLTNSATIFTFSGETWSRSELSDVRVRIYAKRGTGSVNSNFQMRFYGATLTIKYSI